MQFVCEGMTPRPTGAPGTTMIFNIVKFTMKSLYSLHADLTLSGASFRLRPSCRTGESILSLVSVNCIHTAVIVCAVIQIRESCR